jgi:hypothetical protein
MSARSYDYDSAAAMREARRRKDFERIVKSLDPQTRKLVETIMNDIYMGVVNKKANKYDQSRPVSPLFAKVYAIELTIALLSKPEFDPLILGVMQR